MATTIFPAGSSDWAARQKANQRLSPHGRFSGHATVSVFCLGPSRGLGRETEPSGDGIPEVWCGPAVPPRERPRLGLLDTGPSCTGSQELKSACWWLLGETGSIGLRPAPKWARPPPGGSGCQPGRRRWAVGPGLEVLLLLLPLSCGFGSPLWTVAWEFDPKCVDDHGRVKTKTRQTQLDQ